MAIYAKPYFLAVIPRIQLLSALDLRIHDFRLIQESNVFSARTIHFFLQGNPSANRRAGGKPKITITRAPTIDQSSLEFLYPLQDFALATLTDNDEVDNVEAGEVNEELAVMQTTSFTSHPEILQNSDCNNINSPPASPQSAPPVILLEEGLIFETAKFTNASSPPSQLQDQGATADIIIHSDQQVNSR